jgi:hypothetical protein
MVRRLNNVSTEIHGPVMVFVGDEKAVEVRALIRAMKRGNARGAKGGRKVEVE